MTDCVVVKTNNPTFSHRTHAFWMQKLTALSFNMLSVLPSFSITYGFFQHSYKAHTNLDHNVISILYHTPPSSSGSIFRMFSAGYGHESSVLFPRGKPFSAPFPSTWHHIYPTRSHQPTDTQVLVFASRQRSLTVFACSLSCKLAPLCNDK